MFILQFKRRPILVRFYLLQSRIENLVYPFTNGVMPSKKKTNVNISLGLPVLHVIQFLGGLVPI